MSNNYLSFFNLNDDPFRLTPDISYFYNSPAHATALLSLEYCIKQKEGFCVLTGEPGTGKTTILRLFTEKWKDQAEIALIMTPRLMPDEFFQAVLDDFKIPRTTTNRNDMIKAFRDFLLSHAANDKRVVIIVDEAQELPDTTLEELRLLSNLETEKEKLLQIMLVGQHELCDKLLSAPLRQLNQRITVRVQLKPLTKPETSDYINTRLIRGGNSSLLYNQKAKDLIYEYANGIPRTINLIASRGLMSAFLDGSREVLEKHVEQGASDVMDATPSEPFAKPVSPPRTRKKKSGSLLSQGFFSSFSLRRTVKLLCIALFTGCSGIALFGLSNNWNSVIGMFDKQFPSQKTVSQTPRQLAISSSKFANTSAVKKPKQLTVSSSKTAVPPMSNFSSAGTKSTETVKPRAPKTGREKLTVNPRQAAIDSLNTIIKEWKYQTVSRADNKKSNLISQLDSFAASRGLHLLVFTGSIDYLVQCNYPSLILIGGSANTPETYTALTKVSSNGFSVKPAVNGRNILSRKELEALWRGKALIIWKNYIKIPSRIPSGSTIKQMITLQKLLENSGVANITSGVFDQKTETAIKQYQKMKGLKVTGQPDSLTLLQLYNESKYVLHPTLK